MGNLFKAKTEEEVKLNEKVDDIPQNKMQSPSNEGATLERKEKESAKRRHRTDVRRLEYWDISLAPEKDFNKGYENWKKQRRSWLRKRNTKLAPIEWPQMP